MKLAVSGTIRLRTILKQAQGKMVAFTLLRSGKAWRKRTKAVFFYCLILTVSFLIATASLTFAQNPPRESLDESTIETLLNQGNFSNAITAIEQHWENEYQNYFGEDFSPRLKDISEIQKTLTVMARQTGKKPAVIWAYLRKDKLELLLLTPENQLLYKSVPEAKREAFLKVAQDFSSQITNPRKIDTTSYLPSAQQLYQWLVEPLEPTLQAQKIETLLFCVGTGLRTLPLAALHDGQQFLTEKYSLARIPAFSLTDTRYTDLRNAKILAMGASEFTSQSPLPAVPVELSAIAKVGQSESFLNQDFTLVNLQSQRLLERFRIIHLATHAEFKPGAPRNSYIQFWDGPLRLDQMRELRWNNPPVELLVLSACRTALGDKDVELGFGGLAVEAGVKSALASLWYVSDLGTLALMSEFYNQLQVASMKAEALRSAQMAMISGKVQVEKRQLRTSKGNLSLPPELATSETEKFSHPYYWAAFMMIGSPW